MSDSISRTYFMNQKDFQENVESNPEFGKVYLNMDIGPNRISLSLSKQAGDKLYLISNTDHSDMSEYFKTLFNFQRRHGPWAQHN